LEPVLYAKYDGKFPSDCTELKWRFVGIAENVGHSMTYKILTEDDKIIHQAVARSARKGGGFANKRADREAPKRDPTSKVTPITVNEDKDEESNEEGDSAFIKSINEEIVKSLHKDRVNRGELLPTIDSTGLLGRTFIPDLDKEGEQTQARVEGVNLMNQQTADGKEELYKFRCKVGEKTFEHIMTYNKMLECCNCNLDKDNMYQIEAIIGHKKDSKAKGGYQLHVRWASGETTWQDVSPLYTRTIPHRSPYMP
jgi:hypothetical protein